MAKGTVTEMVFERDKVISVRFTAGEVEEIKRAAAQMGLRPGTYLRVAALERARQLKDAAK